MRKEPCVELVDEGRTDNGLLVGCEQEVGQVVGNKLNLCGYHDQVGAAQDVMQRGWCIF